VIRLFSLESLHIEQQNVGLKELEKSQYVEPRSWLLSKFLQPRFTFTLRSYQILYSGFIPVVDAILDYDLLPGMKHPRITVCFENSYESRDHVKISK
jgi:hypothetical protein